MSNELLQDNIPKSYFNKGKKSNIKKKVTKKKQKIVKKEEDQKKECSILKEEEKEFKLFENKPNTEPINYDYELLENKIKEYERKK